MVNKKIRQKKKLHKQKKRVKLKKEFKTTLDFPFIINAKVMEYIKRSKVMFIMRGLPGSGKSTIVKIFQEKYPKSVLCSADSFFTTNGIYEFDQASLKDAHENCQKLAQNACDKNSSVIVIDNTNIMKWEVKYYLELAVRCNYIVILVSPKTPWRLDPAELALKNSHGVSFEVLQKKAKIFQEMIPLYYGWFFNESDSQKLLDLGNKYRQLCLDHCSQLKEVLLSFRQENQTDAEDGVDEETWLEEYFSRIGSAGILHCTSRFCRWGKVEGATSYHRQEHVQDACGKLYQLSITGLTITPRTIAIRVKLDNKQLHLWQNDAKEVLPTSAVEPESKHNGEELSVKVFKETSTNQNSKGDCIRNSAEQRTARYKADNTQTIMEQKSVVSDNPFSVLDTENETPDSSESIDSAVKDSIKGVNSDRRTVKESIKGDNSDRENFSSCTGLSAHVTLGYAKGCRAQQSGPDIAEIVKISAINKPIFVKSLDEAVIHYYGEGRCEIIFTQCLKMTSIFSGHY